MSPAGDGLEGSFFMKENVLLEKSISFSIRIINLSKHLKNEKKEFEISKQLLKSGTSIGANIREAEYGQSKNDFISKMSIALKEAAETDYWLILLYKTEYLKNSEYESLKNDCEELIKLLTAILKTSKSH